MCVHVAHDPAGEGGQGRCQHAHCAQLRHRGGCRKRLGLSAALEDRLSLSRAAATRRLELVRNEVGHYPKVADRGRGRVLALRTAASESRVQRQVHKLCAHLQLTPRTPLRLGRRAARGERLGDAPSALLQRVHHRGGQFAKEVDQVGRDVRALPAPGHSIARGRGAGLRGAGCAPRTGARRTSLSRSSAITPSHGRGQRSSRKRRCLRYRRRGSDRFRRRHRCRHLCRRHRCRLGLQLAHQVTPAHAVRWRRRSKSATRGSACGGVSAGASVVNRV